MQTKNVVSHGSLMAILFSCEIDCFSIVRTSSPKNRNLDSTTLLAMIASEIEGETYDSFDTATNSEMQMTPQRIIFSDALCLLATESIGRKIHSGSQLSM